MAIHPSYTVVRDAIYEYFVHKYRGDRLKAMTSADDVFKYIDLYGKHISEMPSSKQIPEYCIGQICFDTRSRRDLFYSIYPDIAPIIEEVSVEPPTIQVEERYVLFDMMIGMYYGSAVSDDDLRLVRRIYKCSAYEQSESFDANMKGWIQLVTQRRIGMEFVAMEDEIRGGMLKASVYHKEHKHGFTDGIKIRHSERGFVTVD